MQRLYSWSKLGVNVHLSVADRTLDWLADGLHSCAQSDCAAGLDASSADLAWRRDGRRNVIELKGSEWGIFPTPEHLYLHSDKLIDDLVRERLGDIVILHAATVVSPAGRSLMICGASGSGKTSLATALIRKEWYWLSDEYALIGSCPPLTIQGWPRNFNLKERSFADFPETSALPDSREFGLQDRRGRLRFFNPSSLRPGSFLHETKPDTLVFPVFDAALPAPRVEPLSNRETIRRLAGEFLTKTPSTFAVLSTLVATCTSLELRYPEPIQGAGLLENL